MSGPATPVLGSDRFFSRLRSRWCYDGPVTVATRAFPAMPMRLSSLAITGVLLASTPVRAVEFSPVCPAADDVLALASRLDVDLGPEDGWSLPLASAVIGLNQPHLSAQALASAERIMTAAPLEQSAHVIDALLSAVKAHSGDERAKALVRRFAVRAAEALARNPEAEARIDAATVADLLARHASFEEARRFIVQAATSPEEQALGFVQMSRSAERQGNARLASALADEAQRIIERWLEASPVDADRLFERDQPGRAISAIVRRQAELRSDDRVEALLARLPPLGTVATDKITSADIAAAVYRSVGSAQIVAAAYAGGNRVSRQLIDGAAGDRRAAYLHNAAYVHARRGDWKAALDDAARAGEGFDGLVAYLILFSDGEPDQAMSEALASRIESILARQPKLATELMSRREGSPPHLVRLLIETGRLERASQLLDESASSARPMISLSRGALIAKLARAFDEAGGPERAGRMRAAERGRIVPAGAIEKANAYTSNQYVRWLTSLAANGLSPRAAGELASLEVLVESAVRQPDEAGGSPSPAAADLFSGLLTLAQVIDGHDPACAGRDR